MDWLYGDLGPSVEQGVAGRAEEGIQRHEEGLR